MKKTRFFLSRSKQKPFKNIFSNKKNQSLLTPHPELTEPFLKNVF